MQEAINLTEDSPSPYPKRQKTLHTVLPKTTKRQDEKDNKDKDEEGNADEEETKAVWKAMESGIVMVN